MLEYNWDKIISEICQKHYIPDAKIYKLKYDEIVIKTIDGKIAILRTSDKILLEINSSRIRIDEPTFIYDPDIDIESIDRLMNVLLPDKNCLDVFRSLFKSAIIAPTDKYMSITYKDYYQTDNVPLIYCWIHSCLNKIGKGNEIITFNYFYLTQEEIIRNLRNNPVRLFLTDYDYEYMMERCAKVDTINFIIKKCVPNHSNLIKYNKSEIISNFLSKNEELYGNMITNNKKINDFKKLIEECKTNKNMVFKNILKIMENENMLFNHIFQWCLN